MIDQLRDLAVRFRTAIDDADRSNWGATFNSFPRGSCGAVSEMFGTYLLKEFSVDSCIISAIHSKGYNVHGSHGWLKVTDIIVDLACDQFPHDPISAPYVDTDPSWHNQWTIKSENEFADFLQNNAGMFSTWRTAYKDVLTAMKQPESG